ncbi:MAG TPA: TonB-dependent receptor [Bacteroidetes bacterium]|nr:TonB-dependent receptor [Bacteroidota bacterium]
MRLKIIKKAFIFFFLFAGFHAYAQEIRISVSGEPLNKVLAGIRDDYKVQISFDDHLLSQYVITLKARFKNPEKAINKLLSGLPFDYEKPDNVFIIYQRKTEKKKKEFYLSGQIIDAISHEPLPYSHIIINGRPLAADVKGSFMHVSVTDSVFTVQATHLGYYILDTTLKAQTGLRIALTPSSIGLKEVVIKDRPVEKATQIGDKPGLMKMNHKIAFFLPGFGDNSIFNLLRLMPGITASGEQTNDLIIWGSYAGQSEVLFDGFTVYGLKNFNDNISSFNPIMAKDIEVHKGGYGVRFGQRVGGVVNVTGKNGNMQKPSFTFMINNMTLNGEVEIPILKKSSLVLAFRQTYYNLYNPSDMGGLIRRNHDADTSNDIDVNIVPNYRFRDMNIKYSLKINDNDLFYVSLYGGDDKFSYNIDQPVDKWRLIKNTLEKNTQTGGTVFYGKTWKNGNTSNFNLNFSQLNSGYSDDLKLKHRKINYTAQLSDKKTKNLVSELTLRNDNRFALGKYHILETNEGLVYNHVVLKEDTFNVKSVDIESFAQRFFVSVQDYMALGKKVIFKPGLRLTYAFNLNKLFADPRLSLSVQLGEHWKFNAAWGVYHQYITKSSVVDEMGNYRFIWAIANNVDVPVLSATHFVLGLSLHQKGWTFSMEPYYKRVYGITRYFFSQKYLWQGILVGDSKMYGVDFFLQKDFKGHSAWISYSLGKTEERFTDLPDDSYHRAPQDQQHEIKAALLLNFDPFYFSTNYVYGSGFPYAPYPYNQEKDLTYNRWDVSFIYKFLNRKVVGEGGLSILNVLNTQNIKYTNFQRIPASQTNSINIYAEAIPFTPTLFLKFSL